MPLDDVCIQLFTNSFLKIAWSAYYVYISLDAKSKQSSITFKEIPSKRKN